MNDLIDHSDIIFECSGDVIHATDSILATTNAMKKVVTLNAEFHTTTGSYFVHRSDYVTDADGQDLCIIASNTSGLTKVCAEGECDYFFNEAMHKH